MKLLMISQTAYYIEKGQVFALGSVAEETDYLARVFTEVSAVGFLYKKEKTKARYFLPVKSNNFKLIGVLSAGGDKLLDKVYMLLVIPYWAAVILRELKRCDLVHIRCPANISLIAVLLLAFLRHPKLRWVKYAGAWDKPKVPLFYALQRWLLHKNIHRGVVTINGRWRNQASHEISFFNPSITQEDIIKSASAVEEKRITYPLQILFVGRLEKEKGPGHVIEAAAVLIKKGVLLRVVLIGEGRQRKELEALAEGLGIKGSVDFKGSLEHPQVKQYMLNSHFLVLPSVSEGWPKVLSEAFAFGAFCIASNISAIPQILVDNQYGRVLNEISGSNIAGIIDEVIKTPDNWKRIINQARGRAGDFTYENYIEKVNELFQKK